MSAILRATVHRVLVAGLACATLTAPAFAAGEPARSAFDAAFARGRNWSINYDRRVSTRTALRIGFGGWGIDSGLHTIPMSASTLIGDPTASFELGAGPMFVTGDNLSDFGSNVMVVGFAGIRIQPARGGLLLRADAGTLYGGGAWMFWPSASFGITF